MTATVEADNTTLARRWAGFYRERGFNPLPSRPDAKRPFVRYADWWEQDAPADLFDRHPTTNIQLMTGRHWRLLVIDLDGEEARERFAKMGQVPLTWATHSGGNGLHLWFRLNPGTFGEIPKAILWKGGEKHSAIERLCDRSLIMVPPSIHPTTGRRYRFLDRRHSPAGLPMPAWCPAWVLRLKPVEAERPTVCLPAARPAKRVTTAGRWRAADVLDAIPDKIALAESWGLRVASRRPNVSGWCSCHKVGAEDRSPSASVSATTGRYWEPDSRTISLFELAVRLGAYLSFEDAVNDLGARFRVREAG
jgi:hypothetical protein